MNYRDQDQDQEQEHDQEHDLEHEAARWLGFLRIHQYTHQSGFSAANVTWTPFHSKDTEAA
jgi:hypothetical protein